MPHGRTGQKARDYMTQRELLNQDLNEGISGRNGAGRSRGHDTRGYSDSNRGGPRTAGSRHNYPTNPLNASGASRGHGGHRAAPGGEDSEDSPEFSDDDPLAGESVGPRAGGARGSRGMGPYGSGNRGAFPEDSLELVPRRSRVTGPPYAGTRGQQRGGQGLPVSREAGSRYVDTSFQGSSEEPTDNNGVRVGVAASAYRGAGSSRRHQELPPHSRGGGMYQGGRSGLVDSVDSEAELGGRNTSIRQYRSSRTSESYGPLW